MEKHLIDQRARSMREIYIIKEIDRVGVWLQLLSIERGGTGYGPESKVWTVESHRASDITDSVQYTNT